MVNIDCRRHFAAEASLLHSDYSKMPRIRNTALSPNALLWASDSSRAWCVRASPFFHASAPDYSMQSTSPCGPDGFMLWPASLQSRSASLQSEHVIRIALLHARIRNYQVRHLRVRAAFSCVAAASCPLKSERLESATASANPT